MPTADQGPPALFAAGDERRVAAVLDAGPLVGCLQVTAPGHVNPARTLSELLTFLHPEAEVRLAEPEGSRWTVDELVDQVIDPTRFGHPQGRHIVVADAHAALPAAHDKLLKVLEERGEGTVVWLCHPDTEHLPDTLSGRVQRVVTLVGPSWEERVSALTLAGVEDPVNVLRAAAGDLHLAWVAGRFGLVDTLSTLRAPYRSEEPHLQATRLLACAAHLAVALHHRKPSPPSPPLTKAEFPTADLKKLRPEHRSSLRRIIRGVLDQWENEVLASLSRGVPATEAAAALASIDVARTGLIFNTPYLTILVAALNPEGG